MKIVTKVFIFLISFLVIFSAYAEKIKISSNELLLLSSGVGDDFFHYFINKDEIQYIPKWNGEGEPPLSNSDVTSLVLKKHKKINGNIDSEIKKISLRNKNTNCNAKQECPEVLWYYKVKVKGEKRGTYIVLTNGEFVEPRTK